MPPITSQTGKIFSLCGSVGGARSPHPHLVAIDLSEDCLLIPAFTSGGPEIKEYKRLVFAALGLRADQAWVEIDNAVHVRFFDGRPGNLATWVVERADRWTHKDLTDHTPIGEMDEAGLLLILSRFLDLMSGCEGRFSPHLRKRVNRMVTELKAKMSHKP
jgi:hypothetical protein